MTSDSFSRFSCRRWSAGTSTLSNLVASFANRAAASIGRLVRARGDRFGVVGDVGLLHPAGLALLRCRAAAIVSLTVSRKALASAGVALPDAGDGDCRRASGSDCSR